MKAVLIRDYGTNDVVRVEEVDRPEPGAGEVWSRFWRRALID